MKTLKSITLFVSPSIIFYLLGAFVGWKWNPANWAVDSRLMLVFLGLFAGIACTIANIIYGKENK
jgi:uncharacterized membrane protein